MVRHFEKRNQYAVIKWVGSEQIVNALISAGLIFSATAGAGIASLVLGRRLPEHHLAGESRDAVRLVASFLAALTALVLSLLIASAKANYDQHNAQLHQIAADVVGLDRALTRYGDSAQELRTILQSALAAEFDRLSDNNRIRGVNLAQPVRDSRIVGFYNHVQALVPQTNGQRSAQDQAEQLTERIAATRVLMTQDAGGSIPSPFLVVLGFWMAVIFASFGLFVRANYTVVTALLAGAVSVAGAVFLILEFDRPLDGLMRLSTEPIRRAVEMVGR